MCAKVFWISVCPQSQYGYGLSTTIAFGLPPHLFIAPDIFAGPAGDIFNKFFFAQLIHRKQY